MSRRGTCTARKEPDKKKKTEFPSRPPSSPGSVTSYSPYLELAMYFYYSRVLLLTPVSRLAGLLRFDWHRSPPLVLFVNLCLLLLFLFCLPCFNERPRCFAKSHVVVSVFVFTKVTQEQLSSTFSFVLLDTLSSLYYGTKRLCR